MPMLHVIGCFGLFDCFYRVHAHMQTLNEDIKTLKDELDSLREKQKKES
jgi:hypothetical protein